MKTRSTAAKRAGAKRTLPNDKAGAQVAQLLAQCQTNIKSNPYIGQKDFPPINGVSVAELFEKELPAKLKAFDCAYLTGMRSAEAFQSWAKCARKLNPQNPFFDLDRDHARYAELLSTLEQAAYGVRECVQRMEAVQVAGECLHDQYLQPPKA